MKGTTLARPKMSRRCWSWTRILVLLLSAKAASSTEPTSVPENLTAAAMANGEIAANAAAAAGATPQAIIENAANTAGIEAAYSAQVQSLSPPEVEAAAAQAAEGSAKMVGATPEEAATAGGKVAVQVAQKGTTGTTATAVADPYAMVPGTRCLNWWGDGCRSITNEDACKSSRDGSDRAMSDDGKKTFGQPCVWCAGQPCTANATLTSVCAPLITLPNPLPAGFETATCSGDETEKSSRLDWQQSVPDELRGGGYPRRDLNFEPVFNPGDEEKTGGRACRAKSTEDASNLNPFARNYFSTWTADLTECFDICSWKQDCTGIEHSDENNYCEVWNTPIEWVSMVDGYTCFQAMPATSNASAAAVRWRAGDTMAVEDVGMAVPSEFWLIGGFIVVALLVAICVVWRSRKRNKKDDKKTKRSVKTGQNPDQTGSADEMQPLVGAGTPTNGSSAPSYAGSFSNLHASGRDWSQTTPFATSSSGYGGYSGNGGFGSEAGYSGHGGYGYEAVGGQAGQAPQVGDSNYLQQLRQWLQQYEAARFQELAHLQSNPPQAAWGQTPAWPGAA